MSSNLPLAVLLFSSLAMSGAMGLAWLQFGRERHTLFWVAAYLTSSLQWILNWCGLTLGSSLLLYLSGLAMIASISLAYRGVLKRYDAAGSAWPIWFSAGLTALITSLTAYTIGYEVGLVFVIPCFAAVTMIMAAAKMVPIARRPRAAERVCSAALLLFGAFEFVLMFLGYQALTNDLVWWRDAYRSVLTIGLPALFIFSGVATILVVAADVAESLASLALRDPLTGLLNRRGLETMGQHAIATAERSNTPIALVAMDLDGFKMLNDQYGHAAGDRALQRVALALQAARRRNDIVSRPGGDEFVIILPNASSDDARRVVGRALEAVRKTEPEHVSPVGVSFSYGVAELEGQESLEQLLARADRQLYVAKNTRRHSAGRTPTDTVQQDLVRQSAISLS